MGLAVSYGIMQEHGGKMQVQSEVGVGTTFRLEFPGWHGSAASSDPDAKAGNAGSEVALSARAERRSMSEGGPC